MVHPHQFTNRWSQLAYRIYRMFLPIAFALTGFGVIAMGCLQFSSRFVVTLPSYIDSLDDLTVLFNTKEEKITTNTQTGQKEFIFERTPVPISSYLVAFAIGEFSFLEMNSNDIRYRIYCSPGKEQYAAFSLNITVELIEFWAGTLNVPYPFNKLDQIAVPKIIEDGMENMGKSSPLLRKNARYSLSISWASKRLSVRFGVREHLGYGEREGGRAQETSERADRHTEKTDREKHTEKPSGERAPRRHSEREES